MSRETGGTSQVAGNHTPWEQRGSLGRQRKAGTSRLTGNHTFGGDKCPRDRLRKAGKGGNLQRPNVTFCSSFSHYNKISLAAKSTHHAPMPWYYQSKLNKDKYPSSSREGGAGMKIREFDPHTSSSAMTILPLHLYAPYNRLAKETQGSSSLLVCLLSLWECILFF